MLSYHFTCFFFNISVIISLFCYREDSTSTRHRTIWRPPGENSTISCRHFLREYKQFFFQVDMKCKQQISWSKGLALAFLHCYVKNLQWCKHWSCAFNAWGRDGRKSVESKWMERSWMEGVGWEHKSTVFMWKEVAHLLGEWWQVQHDWLLFKARNSLTELLLSDVQNL